MWCRSAWTRFPPRVPIEDDDAPSPLRPSPLAGEVARRAGGGVREGVLVERPITSAGLGLPRIRTPLPTSPARGEEPTWTVTASRRLPAYLCLGGARLLARVLFRRPPPGGIRAPPLLAAAPGPGLAPPPPGDVAGP